MTNKIALLENLTYQNIFCTGMSNKLTFLGLDHSEQNGFLVDVQVL
jgi:hypothetical protein